MYPNPNTEALANKKSVLHDEFAAVINVYGGHVGHLNIVRSLEEALTLFDSGLWVLKAEFSWEGDHVFIPAAGYKGRWNMTDRHTSKARSQLIEAWKKCKLRFASWPADYQPTWFAIPVNELLIKCGEVRCWFVWGKLVQCAHVLPGLSVDDMEISTIEGRTAALNNM